MLLVDDLLLRRAVATAAGHAHTAEDFRRRLDPSVADCLDAVAEGAVTEAGPDVLAALTMDASTPAPLTSIRLATQAARTAALVLAGPDRPDTEELDALARRGAVALTNAAMYEERATLAAALRASLQPAPLPDIPGVGLGAVYRPAEETASIGGDFYDVLPTGDGAWSIALGDVCGKGVDAAVLTGQVRQSLRTAGLATSDPVETLHLVNSALLAAGGNDYVTIVHGLLRPAGDGVHLSLAAGGHAPPLMLRGSVVQEIPVGGTIVGMLPDVTFRPAEVVLGPGDLALFFTDGATEARGPDGMLGVGAIAELLADSGDMPAQTVAERMLQRVLEHLDGRRHDDIAFLAVRNES